MINSRNLIYTNILDLTGEYIVDVYSYVECDKSDEEEL